MAVLDERKAQEEARTQELQQQHKELRKEIDEILTKGIGKGLSLEELRKEVEKLEKK